MRKAGRLQRLAFPENTTVSQLQVLKAQIKVSDNTRTKALPTIQHWKLLSETELLLHLNSDPEPRKPHWPGHALNRASPAKARLSKQLREDSLGARPALGHHLWAIPLGMGGSKETI